MFPSCATLGTHADCDEKTAQEHVLIAVGEGWLIRFWIKGEHGRKPLYEASVPIHLKERLPALTEWEQSGARGSRTRDSAGRKMIPVENGVISVTHGETPVLTAFVARPQSVIGPPSQAHSPVLAGTTSSGTSPGSSSTSSLLTGGDKKSPDGEEVVNAAHRWRRPPKQPVDPVTKIERYAALKAAEGKQIDFGGEVDMADIVACCGLSFEQVKAAIEQLHAQAVLRSTSGPSAM